MQINSWNDGYYTGVDVYDGYISEISPLMIDLCLTIAGYSLDSNDKIGAIKNYRYLELGFGRGTSLNIHAASSIGTFVGTDFTPSHSLMAHSFAEASQSDITIYNDSFAELESRLDSMYGKYPKEEDKFDYIVFHGIYSWINDENKDILLNITRKYLKVNSGGIVYNSYNCLPGWAAKMPVRNIFKLYDEYNDDTALKKVDGCINFFDELLKCKPGFANVPHVAQLLKEIPQHQKAYIIHEYFNDNWDIVYFRDVAKRMDKAKCRFICSGRVLEHFDDFNISPEGIAFLNKIENNMFKEQMKDYFTNKQFRIDLYAKACKSITFEQAQSKLLNTNFILLKNPSTFDYEVITSMGKINLSKERYDNILGILSDDKFAPKSLKEIMAKSGLDFSQAVSSMMVLIHKHVAFVAQDVNDKIMAQTRRFNDFLFAKQCLKAQSVYVASPIVARGIAINDTLQVCIKAYNELVRKDSKYVESLGKEALKLYNSLLNSTHYDNKTLESYMQNYVFQIFKPQNRRHIKDGKILQSDSENLEEIGRIAREFITKDMDLFKALGICATAGGGGGK